MVIGNKKSVLGFTLIVLVIGLTPHILAEEEEEEEREDLILSRFSSDDLKLVTDDESEQWANSYETEIDSSWDHDIEIKSLNNGHDLFFLISWEDDTPSVDATLDGLSLILETKEIVKPMTFRVEEDEEGEEEYETHNDTTDIQTTVNEETWVWQADDSTSPNIFVNAEWIHDKWNVVVKRELIVDEIGEIEMGEQTKVFLKAAVWDGNKNQSFDSLDKNSIPELQLLVLPEINSYPKDIYVWSAILAVGTGSFLISEIKKHRKVEGT